MFSALDRLDYCPPRPTKPSNCHTSSPFCTKINVPMLLFMCNRSERFLCGSRVPVALAVSPTCQPNFNQCLSSFPSHRSPPRWVPTSTYRSFTARSRPMLCASCSACGAGSIVNCRQSTVHPALLAQTRPGGWDSEQSRVSLCYFSLNHFTIYMSKNMSKSRSAQSQRLGKWSWKVM